MANDMCHRSIAIVLLITLLFGAGCRAYMSSVQSQFFLKFSLRELFEKNEFNAGLDCSETGGGGGMSFGTGGVGKEESRFSKLDSIACQITDAERFDEAKFIAALRESVIQNLSREKATIVNGKNPEATNFVLLYGLGDVAGAIEISSTKGPASFYTLKASLNEQSKHTQ